MQPAAGDDPRRSLRSCTCRCRGSSVALSVPVTRLSPQSVHAETSNVQSRCSERSSSKLGQCTCRCRGSSCHTLPRPSLSVAAVGARGDVRTCSSRCSSKRSSVEAFGRTCRCRARCRRTPALIVPLPQSAHADTSSVQSSCS
jgi:hypothetical protein